MKQEVIRQTLVVLALLTLAACDREAPEAVQGSVEEPAAKPFTVYTVNYPLAYFAERLIGDAGTVVFPAPADVDPAMWSPGPEAIVGYQQADLILLNGAGYASWVANATLPRSRLVDTTAAVADKLIPIEDTVTHSHGPTGDHSHGGTAFTTWLDAGIATAQARAVLEALVGARPQLEADFRAAFAALEADIAEVDAGLAAAAQALGDQPVLFSHPVYQYFERRYDLNGFAMHWEPGEVPAEAEWRSLRSLLEQHPAKLMIWEGEPLPETKDRLLQLGIETVVFEPGGNRPANGNWLDLMRRGIAELQAN